MISIAHLGPSGNYSEQAALFYINWLAKTQSKEAILCPYPSIGQSLKAVAQENALLAVVPAENSIEGSVTMTMDTMWQLDSLHIQLALVMPIVHVLISCASMDSIKTVYSHPQALAQCQGWLERFLPTVQLIATNSTTETLQKIESEEGAATISSQRAAQLYNLPILAAGINDHPDNCTKFWVVSSDNTFQELSQDWSQDLRRATNKRYTSLAFSLRANTPGALFKALRIFAQLNINLSRIESRPTKRSLGEYLFFIDLEADFYDEVMQSALKELSTDTEVLKIFGSYDLFSTKDM